MSIKVTRGERLLIHRRRLGQTQTEAAQREMIPVKLYGQWERDEVQADTLVGIGPLQPHERCLLLRRRARLTQAEVAQDIGCSRWWLNRMEQGLVDADALLEYWAE